MVADLRWSEEQQQLGSMISSLLAKHCDSTAVRAAIGSSCGYDEKLWRLLCEQVGVAALAVPEEHGGAGFGFLETAVVLEQLGNALAPSPLLSSVVAAAVLLRAGDPDACARLLPSVAGGRVATLVWAGTAGGAGSPEPVVASGATRDGCTLSGTVPLVLDGDTAEVLLVVARTDDGVGLFEVDPDASGLRRSRTPAMDPTLRLADVELNDVAAVRIGDEMSDALTAVHAVACAAVAAVQVGVAQRALDMTVAYSKERVQFGRAIGSFQALKHRMADMLVLVETARSAAMDAAFAVADHPTTAGLPADELVRRTSVAKAWCSDALSQVAAETVQLHGGIAITWEHDAQLVFKRAHALAHLFGPPHAHRRAVLLG